MKGKEGQEGMVSLINSVLQSKDGTQPAFVHEPGMDSVFSSCYM